uniref:Protein kinase domain-containing protein n=1 Tax=Trichuris muris TaxID=70415 RepID=A0A5S6R5E3_TRIMR
MGHPRPIILLPLANRHPTKRPAEMAILWIMVVALSVARTSMAFDLGDCNLALGMESREIGDEALTASSSFDENSVGPRNARIKTEQNGGAWCPRRQINPTVREWLQIDLGTRRLVTGVETQGRYGDGVGQEFATAYSIEYWRPELAGWHRYKDRSENEILPANNDTSTAVLRKMDSPFVASKVRIVPWSDHTRTVCMRVELHGCSFADPMRSYSAPWSLAEDDRRWADNSYDGVLLPNGTVTGGLGQLYDGVVGSERLLNSSYDWVGWRRSETGSTVSLEFTFSAVRNFTSVSLHVGYFETKLMGAFSAASLHFGATREEALQRAPLEFGPPVDSLSRGARWVTLPTEHRLARCLLVKLEMAMEWLLISELKFESTPARVPSVGQRRFGNLPAGSLLNPSRKSSVAILSYDFVPTEYVALAVGVVLVLLGTGAVFLAIYLLRQRRMNASKDRRARIAPIYAYDCLAPVGRADPDFAKGLEALLTANGTVMSVAGRPTVPTNRPGDKMPSSPARMYGARELSPSDDCYYSEYADPDMASSPTVPLIPPPPVVERRRSMSGTSSLQTGLFGKKRRSCALDGQHGLAYSLYYASSDVTNPEEEEEEVQGANHVSVPLANLLASIQCPVVKRSCLEMQEKLGEGEFSEVHLYRMKVGSGGIGRQVAVKTKRSGGDDNCWKDFERELRVLAKLDHPNIVKLLGVSTDRGDCLLLVFEHMQNGDLNQYLRVRGARLSSADLLRFTVQIADGMRYLESLHFVHRDLATRNCLLNGDMSIKIADFGMARSLYQNDYYRIEGRFVLPIRWMAWECVLLGKFSTKTDVWAFGVTLWEVYTLAAEQPFALCNDQQVIENLQHMYYNQGLLVYLPKPDVCPTELYALMMSCWSKEDRDRPTFADIRSLLQGFAASGAAIGSS